MNKEIGDTAIKRPHYEQRLKALIDIPVIKVLTGVRRCGKSTILSRTAEHIRHEKPDARIIELNLESAEGLEIRQAAHLRDFIEKKAPSKTARTYFFFDEIQRVQDWEDVINALRVSWNCDIYVTGSNSVTLSGHLSTNIAGRYQEIRIRPFVFSEFVRLYEHLQLSHSELLSKYIDFGGYPMLKFFNFEPTLSTQYLQSLFDSAVRRDVIEYHQIRDVNIFDRVLDFCLHNIGSSFSAQSVARFLKSQQSSASVDTVLNYMAYCEEAFLIEKAPRWNVHGKELLRVNEKYFAADLGLRWARGFSNTADIERALENIVFNELRVRGYDVRIASLPGGKEIDFVAMRNGESEYYQVSYLLAGESTIEREFGAYQQVSDSYPKYVLSLDPLTMSRDGVIHKNLTDWLLEEQ